MTHNYRALPGHYHANNHLCLLKLVMTRAPYGVKHRHTMSRQISSELLTWSSSHKSQQKERWGIFTQAYGFYSDVPRSFFHSYCIFEAAGVGCSHGFKKEHNLVVRENLIKLMVLWYFVLFK